MIYYLFSYLKHYYPIFDVLYAVSVRSLAALCTSFVLSLLYGRWFIIHFEQFFKAKAREYTPQTHQVKDSTPTMGGLFILASTLSSIFLWCNYGYVYVWICIAVMIGFGLLGAIDDWKKIRTGKGISVQTKFRLQLLCALVIAVILFKASLVSSMLTIPLCNYSLSLGWWFVPWVMFILVGTSNAVNLTDGLDGLASTVLLSNFAFFSIVCYLSSQSLLTFYLGIPFYDVSELTVVSAALFGSVLGFLWYNTYPARVFMGDVGSLFLGASLGLLALLSKREFLLACSGALFVIETLSVIAQVVSVKLFKKRLFKMAPLHHHFELLGMHEATITTRCGIITFLLCVIGFLLQFI